MMIELVMYGMIPSPKTANRVSAPPENRLRKPSTPPLSAASVRRWTASKSMPGTGTWEPNRYRAMTSSVKRILFRRSGDPEHVQELHAEPPGDLRLSTALSGWSGRCPWPADARGRRAAAGPPRYRLPP